MQYIKSKHDLSHIKNAKLALTIAERMLSLEMEYQQPYEATQFGWFVICEMQKELFEPLPDFSFSISNVIQDGRFEYIEEMAQWFELLIMLNDCEGILVFIPKALLSQHLYLLMSDLSSSLHDATSHSKNLRTKV